MAKEKEKPQKTESKPQEKAEETTTRELRSSDQRLLELRSSEVEKVTEAAPEISSTSTEAVTSKIITSQIESQCKQTVDDLIARYLARKPLPGKFMFNLFTPVTVAV